VRIMKTYDVIIIGSGAGASIAEAAVQQGMSVAIVDKGPLGGTCLNVGCIPSKMLIFPADRVAEISETRKLGISAEIKSIDFAAIMRRMRSTVQNGQDHIRAGLKHAPNLDLYEESAHFVADYTLEVGNEQINGKKIFIASGARVLVPPIEGLGNVDYLTNESMLLLDEKPESMLIIGGGYIAVEFGHFFASMGTDVAILQRGPRLVPEEEPEISELLKSEMEKRMAIHVNTEAFAVSKSHGSFIVTGRNKNNDEDREFKAEKILLAAGRKSNAYLLRVEKTGVKTDERGFISVNKYLETSKKNIWALGDATGNQMFRHVANEEADLAWHNSIHGHKGEMNYRATPHAVFTHPQIAGVGLREDQARKGHKILVGRAGYSEVAKGEAMMEDQAFAKAIVEKDSLKILGFHIIGPYAPILIQEVVNAMANDMDIYSIARSMHIHPALPEVILAAFGNLKEA
jgi:dihydrolipoamide dehydrogenase